MLHMIENGGHLGNFRLIKLLSEVGLLIILPIILSRHPMATLLVVFIWEIRLSRSGNSMKECNHRVTVLWVPGRPLLVWLISILARPEEEIKKIHDWRC